MHNYITDMEWNDNYVQFSFTCTKTSKCLQIPHSMFCNTVFLGTNFKPSELQDNFNSRHGKTNFSGYDLKSLKAKRIRFESRKIFSKLGFVSTGKPLLMATYMWIITKPSPRKI